MISSTNVASASLALLCLTVGLVQQSSVANANLLGVGNIVGGLTNGLSSSLAGTTDSFAQSGGAAALGSGGSFIPNFVGGVGNTVGGMMKPVMGMLGSMTGGMLGQNGLVGGALQQTLGGISGLAGGDASMISNNLRLATGAIDGISTGLSAGMSGVERANGIGAPAGVNPALASGLALHANFKRQALADSMMVNGAADAATAAAASTAAGGEMLNQAGAIEAGAAATEAATGLGATSALDAAAATSGVLNAANTVATGIAAEGAVNQVAARQKLAADAMRNSQAESTLAGSQMVAHGANNAFSASLASNAYRQAKLASARDRVNIAGTIQNSARISDAAIATHDAATKAEDSLLGSELAVDSAATVLDSDAAYIPPVTSSLLRSLPYGRLGIRNIIPKPLNYPSAFLPDVWLNGKPVNYLNVPLRMYPYNFGPYGPHNLFNFANGIYNGQPFMSNNGLILNGMFYDPAYAYLLNSNLYGAVGSSVVPILANAQLEAQDEVAMANLLQMQQLNGAGMLSTYQGYGRLNPVPMVTGTVSDVNLMPTTTIGTTYPIGSALVIEPRDSYFQDYNDNASSRQHFDERQQ